MTGHPRTTSAGPQAGVSRGVATAMIAGIFSRSLTIHDMRVRVGLAGWQKLAMKFLRFGQFGGPQSPRPRGRGAD